MHFRNRLEAGRLLALELDKFVGANCVVYALPRGGVVLGVEVAKYLNAPLDIIITRKVGHPNWNEYAVCAIGEGGQIVYNTDETAQLDPIWLKYGIDEARSEARRRRKVYLAGRNTIDPRGKTAIIVDDGIATGLTILAAIKELRNRKPERIIVAVPVAPAKVVSSINKLVDEVIVLETAEPYLGSVGAYYDNFEQTTDAEVTYLLSTYAVK